MRFILFLLLFMNLSGTIAFLSYLILTFFADRYISARFRYICLKLCLFLFLVPVPLIKHLLVRMFSPQSISTGRVHVYKNIEYALHQTDHGFFLSPLSDTYRWILGIWAAVLIVIGIHQLYCFLRFRRSVQKYSIRNEASEAMLDALKEEEGIPRKRRIALYYCQTPISPFTYGVFRPAVVLTGLADEKSCDIILRHELQHVRFRDFLYRIFAMLAVLLHCFNPAVYFLFRELKEVQEMNCDERILKLLSENDRKRYGYTIIEIAQNARPVFAPALYFSRNSKAFLEKRIRRIKYPCDRKQTVMCILFGVICLLSAVPVYAYKPYTIDWRGDETITRSSLEGVYEIEEEIVYEEESGYFMPEDEALFQKEDHYMVTEDGTIVEMAFTEKKFSDCEHRYKKGIWKQHSTNQKGCEVLIYTTKYCAECEYVQEKLLDGVDMYEPCPHRVKMRER